MYTTTRICGGTGRTVEVLHASVPVIKEPPLLDHNKVTIDEKEYYMGWGGKIYLADLFDRMFKVNKGTVKPRTKKGPNEVITLSKI